MPQYAWTSLAQHNNSKGRLYISGGIAALFLFTFISLTGHTSNSGTSSFWSAIPFTSGGYSVRFPQENLAQKWRRGEEIYNSSVIARNELIQKLGPSPKDIHPFPGTNVDPVHRLYQLWDFLVPAFPCPHFLERVGVTGDGGKWVCGADRLVQVPDCVIYSFGVEQQSSFEATLLKASPHCKIWAYDFSVEHIGPEIQQDPALAERVQFKQYRFDNINLPKSAANPETKTLDAIMRENQHDFIHLLKVDVEGSEFAVLQQIIDYAKGGVLPFAQLQLEIHAWFEEKEVSFADYIEWWELLEAAGLRPFYRELNYQSAMTSKVPNVIEYSFLNVRGSHYLNQDAL